MLSFPSCGACLRCRTGRSAYCDSIATLKFGCRRPDGSVATTDAAGRPVGDHFFGQSSFGTLAVVNGRSVVPMPDDVDLRIAGPLACGVQTGAGTVLDVLRVRPRLLDRGLRRRARSGSARSWRRGWPARRRSSRSTAAPSRLRPGRRVRRHPPGLPRTDVDPVEAIRDATGGRGVEFAFETTGVPEVLTHGRPVAGLARHLRLRRHGAAGRAGRDPDARGDDQGADRPRASCRATAPRRATIPRLWDLHRRGLLPFDRLITHYRLDEINQAARRTPDRGDVVKPVLLMS